MIQIIPCDAARFDAMLAFVVRLNAIDEQHIGYLGVTPADITHTIDELPAPASDHFVLAYADQQLVGVLGADIDQALGRAWLYGPLIEHADWQSVADQLYAALGARLPLAIHEHELFFDLRNQPGQHFAERHTFPLHGDAAVLHFSRAQLANLPAASAPEFEPRYFDQLRSLHEQLFPRTYLSAEQMVEQRSDTFKLLLATDGAQLHGYIAAKAEPATGEGYVDFIGVAEHARQQGVGRRLLAAALHWMFGDPAIQAVNLTVMAGNTAALRLYTGLGFAHERTLRAYRKQVV